MHLSLQMFTICLPSLEICISMLIGGVIKKFMEELGNMATRKKVSKISPLKYN